MKPGFQQIGGVFTVVFAGTDVRHLVLEVNAQQIINKLGQKAAHNKAGISRIVSGAVVVRDVRP